MSAGQPDRSDAAAAAPAQAGRLSALMSALLLGCAALVLGGWPASLLFQSLAPARPLSWLESALALVFGAALVAGLQRLGARRRIGTLRGLTLLQGEPLLPLLVGAALRVGEAWWVQPAPVSDAALYLALAGKLAGGGDFVVGGTYAYWPPGLALLLTPLVGLLGAGLATLLAYTLLTFAIGMAGAFQLARAVGLRGWESLPMWLLALWPSQLLYSGLPEKELLVIALLPWVLVAGLRALRGSWPAAVLAGVLCGLAMLVQPSLQLLPLFGLALALVALPRKGRSLLVFAAIAVAMLATVAPWTYRNYRLLGEPVLVSTNGGSNLYRANNALATGGFVAKGTVDVEALDELASNREGRRLAAEWIAANPARFAQLLVGKSLLFSGDDSHSAYAALRRGLPDVDRNAYLAAKLVAALPWLLVWAAIAVCVPALAAASPVALGGAALLMVPYLYLLAIHAVFESGGKYHAPALIPVLVLAALLLKMAGALGEGSGDA